MTTKTIFDVFSDFQAVTLRTNKSVLLGVMHRFLAIHWGGKAPKGSKATNEEVFSFREIMKKTPAIVLVGSKELLEQEFAKKQISKENNKSYRSAYKSFLNWAESNGYFLNIKQIKEDIKLDTQSKIFARQPNGNGQKIKANYHGKTHQQAYTLMGKHNHGRERVGQLIYQSDYINANLAAELKLFEIFRSQNHACSIGTIGKDIRTIYRILGWLHRYKNVSLQDLSLKSIITSIKLNISYSKFKDEKGKVNYHDYIYEKAMVRQEAIDLANQNKRLVEEYTNFIGGHPSTKGMAITTCIAIAKFIFKDEVGTDDYVDDTDLPIIRRLSQLSNEFSKKAKSSSPSVPYSNKSMPWHEALNVLEVLRKKVHYMKTQRVGTRKIKNGMKEYVRTRLRDKNTINNNLQRFLSLAFMLLIPTDRARTYYELEIGKTFVYGLYEDGTFTSLDNLENKDKAIWYIHLMPEDYKTGKIYKEYWGVMPNVEFQDGYKLYNYIDNWINGGREYEQKCNHNFFFRQTKCYKSLKSSDWSNRIKLVFAQETGIPVTPKELRKMYVTHLNNKGATNAELKGAATAMHHSQKMQESDYNSQTIFNRVAPIMELNERMWKEAFKSDAE